MKYDEKQLEKFAAERRACARLVGCAGRHQAAAARRSACLQQPATPQLPPPPPPSSHQPLQTLLPVISMQGVSPSKFPFATLSGMSAGMRRAPVRVAGVPAEVPPLPAADTPAGQQAHLAQVVMGAAGAPAGPDAADLLQVDLNQHFAAAPRQGEPASPQPLRPLQPLNCMEDAAADAAAADPLEKAPFSAAAAAQAAAPAAPETVVRPSVVRLEVRSTVVGCWWFDCDCSATGPIQSVDFSCHCRAIRLGKTPSTQTHASTWAQ